MVQSVLGVLTEKTVMIHMTVCRQTARAHAAMASVSMRYDIMCILNEIRKVTAKFQRDDEENNIRNEWKFAAMVIDRACFVVCLLLTFGSTFAIIWSAPHLIT